MQGLSAVNVRDDGCQIYDQKLLCEMSKCCLDEVSRSPHFRPLLSDILMKVSQTMKEVM